MTRLDQLLAAPLVIYPRRVQRTLNRLHKHLDQPVPNLWQVGLGCLRMQHRLIFRSDTIGLSIDDAPRTTRRARWMKYRPIRFPCLVSEMASAPWDLSGLASPPERIIQHLLAAHHDGQQCLYDLELLMMWPGALETLYARVTAVVDGTHPRSEWLRDLVVFEGYHENLQAWDRSALIDGLNLTTNQTKAALNLEFLTWCLAQLPTPLETAKRLFQGQYHLRSGS